MVRIHSPRPEILLHFKRIRRLEILVSNRRFAILPSFVPTPDHVLRGLCFLRVGGAGSCVGSVLAGAGLAASWPLGAIARSCLKGPRGIAVTRELCRKLKAAVASTRQVPSTMTTPA